MVALKITNNINVLIKDLFHNPPSYKSVVSLSWKPVGVSSQECFYVLYAVFLALKKIKLYLKLKHFGSF